VAPAANVPARVSKAVRRRQKSMASFQFTFSTGCNFARERLGLLSMTLKYCSCVTSYLPTQYPDGINIRTIPMLLVICPGFPVGAIVDPSAAFGGRVGLGFAAATILTLDAGLTSGGGIGACFGVDSTAGATATGFCSAARAASALPRAAL